MRISTVALWSLALWSSGNVLNPAYASAEPDNTDHLPLPNSSSENEAALPFIALETLPSELDHAVALESPVVTQDVIEWSPSLESPAFVNTLDPVDDGETTVVPMGDEQGAVELEAIAPPLTILDTAPEMEWSSVSERNREPMPTANVSPIEDKNSYPNAVENTILGEGEEGDEQLISKSVEEISISEDISEAENMSEAGSASKAERTSETEQTHAVDVEMSTASAMEDNWIGFAPASSDILEVAQLSNASFPDVTTHWARGFVEPLEANGVVVGFPDGTFQPDAALTRAEFAALLDESFVLSPIRSSPNFNDVPANHWANDAIDSAYRSGFISGQSSTRFAPEQSLSRADTLTALVNGLSLTPSDSAPQLSTYFDDSVEVPAYARSAIAAALENEMVVNYPQTRRFRPNDATTRAEAAAFLYQALVHLDAIPELDPTMLASQYIVMPNTPEVADEPSDDRPLTEAEINAIRQSLDGILDSLETDQIGAQRNSSPAITISNPSGFGADNFTGFANFSYQSRTRFGNEDDATAGIGIGFGDAQENVGLQLSYAFASFGGSRDFGSGGFNAKLHRQLPNRWGIALGWEGFLNLGGDNDFEDTVYGSVSKVIETREDVTEPFSRIALSAGVGNGRFRTEEDFNEDNDTISPFGSVAFLLAPPVTSIVEWTGQDLAAGLSITPFRDFPLVITPAVRDITGAGDGARFIISSGLSWQF